MKKILFALLLTLLAFGVNHAHSQKANASITTAFSPAEARKNISIKAVRDFRKQFGSPANETWSTTSDGGFVASFEENGVKHLQFYRSSGGADFHETMYDASHLSKAISSEVNANYEEYEISGVAEIESPRAHLYFINIHNKDNTRFKVLQYLDNELTVVKELENKDGKE